MVLVEHEMCAASHGFNTQKGPFNNKDRQHANQTASRAKTQVHVKIGDEIEEGSTQSRRVRRKWMLRQYISLLQNSALVRFMGDGARVLEYTKSIDHKSGGQCVMASFYLTLLSFSSVRTLGQTHLRTISYRLMKGRHVLGNEQLWNGTSCSSNSNTFICTYYLLGSHLIVFFVGNFKQIL